MCVFQKYNADYDLSAKEGADSLAFISLLEEKLKPALVRNRHTLWSMKHEFINRNRNSAAHMLRMDFVHRRSTRSGSSRRTTWMWLAAGTQSTCLSLWTSSCRGGCNVVSWKNCDCCVETRAWRLERSWRRRWGRGRKVHLSSVFVRVSILDLCSDLRNI